ncbi:MAG: thioredoxin domain-containing protein [Bacteroidetes bacterium]|nr:thioredoxin domain-containing protein [Bacteroidota bacterium]MDA0875305.1 thioredoxin domain-containing protein [Bacteroidota bacterium]
MLRLPLLPLLLAVLLTLAPAAQPSQEPLLSAAGDECSFSQDMAPVEGYLSLISMADPYQGTLDADVTVIVFFDPNCPHCRTFHPVMNQVIADSGQHARFFMIPFPLWQYSLVQVEALFVAAQEGKYFEMLDAQYAHQKQGGMSLDEVAVLAGDIGLDTARFRARVEQGLNQPMILERRAQIASMGVRGTPSVMINGQFVASDSRSRICMNELIAKVANDA